MERIYQFLDSREVKTGSFTNWRAADESDIESIVLHQATFY